MASSWDRKNTYYFWWDTNKLLLSPLPVHPSPRERCASFKGLQFTGVLVDDCVYILVSALSMKLCQVADRLHWLAQEFLPTMKHVNIPKTLARRTKNVDEMHSSQNDMGGCFF